MANRSKAEMPTENSWGNRLKAELPTENSWRGTENKRATIRAELV
jgi:hypothetical protein